MLDVSMKPIKCGITLCIMSLFVVNEASAYDMVTVDSFFISKSENKNQVHYAVQINKECQLRTASPVYAYWDMKEKGYRVFEYLLPREIGAYGIFQQTFISWNKIKIVLNAFPQKPIIIHTFSSSNGCITESYTDIAGVPAKLKNVHAILAWPFGIKRLTMYGIKISDGTPIEEILK